MMREDIISAAELGADGIVAGMLTREGEIDVAQLSEILLLCRSLVCLCPSFYRAFLHHHVLQHALSSWSMTTDQTPSLVRIRTQGA